MNNLYLKIFGKRLNERLYKSPLIFTLILFLLASCYIKQRMHKLKQGREKADIIMNNLSNPGIIEQFPDKRFPHEHLKAAIDTLVAHCDLNNKKGKFVDFFTMSNNGKSSTAYIYEYFLNCDSLRFIYVYDFEAAEPELIHFEIEGLERPNPMIIHPEKSLLNSTL